MLTSFVLTEAQDYRVIVTYDDLTLTITGMTLDVARANDAPLRLWTVAPIVGESVQAVRESSLNKTVVLTGVALEEINHPERGRRLRLLEGFAIGAGT